jgi:hypothetical protein
MARAAGQEVKRSDLVQRVELGLLDVNASSSGEAVLRSSSLSAVPGEAP